SKIPHLSYLFTAPAAEPAGELRLSRKTYPLPRAKAEALSAFLRAYVKAAVLETRVDGDSLTVTTTPEVQQGIGQLLAVLKDLRAQREAERDPTGTESDVILMNQPFFQIPIRVDAQRRQRLREIQLYCA